jgi:hypothetical protein
VAQHCAQDCPGFHWGIGSRAGSRDQQVNLLDESPRQIHTDGNAVLVIDASNRALNDATQVQCDAIGCIGGS